MLVSLKAKSSGPTSRMENKSVRLLRHFSIFFPRKSRYNLCRIIPSADLLLISESLKYHVSKPEAFDTLQ